jgi:hypothetical protein
MLAAQVWKDKPIAQWTADEAKQVLTDSPWAKAVTPTIDKTATAPHTTAGPGGIDIGGVGIGIPGARRGMNGRTQRTVGNEKETSEPPKLVIRWASALPVSAAQVIVHELDSPAVSEDQYAVSIYGLPSSMFPGNTDRIAAELKRTAVLKRDGKKDIKPSTVDVLMREDGPVVVYSFPRSAEIIRQDTKVDFDAQIGRLKITQAFVPAEMMYQGKLEL